MKNCMFCEHCEYLSGSPGYSELTPGSDAEMYCKRKHWLWDFTDYGSINDFRKTLRKAETCSDYIEDKL